MISFLELTPGRVTASIAIPKPTRWYILALIGFSVFPLQLCPASTIATVAPADLLQVLPAVPTNWKCVQGEGKADFGYMVMPRTNVIRKYEIPAKVQPAPAKPPLPPGVLTLVASDVGSLGNPLNQLFDPGKPSPKNAFKLPLLDGLLTERPNHDAVFIAPLGSRLLIQISAHNIESNDFKDFLRSFDFGPLVAFEKQLPTTAVAETTQIQKGEARTLKFTVYHFTTTFVNELNPHETRSYESTRQMLDQ